RDELAELADDLHERRSLVAVEALTKLLAALEEGHVLGLHRHLIAGPGIAARPRRTRSDREGPEAAQLDPAALLKGLGHAIEDHADHALDVALRQVWILAGKLGDQFRLDHHAEPPSSSRDHGRDVMRFQGLGACFRVWRWSGARSWGAAAVRATWSQERR